MTEFDNILQEQIDDLEAAQSGATVPRSILAAYAADPITMPGGGHVVWDIAEVESADMAITVAGDLEFVTAGLYVISLDYQISGAADFVGDFRLAFGASTSPGDNYLTLGNNRFRASVEPTDSSRGNIVTAPPGWFDAGDIVNFDLEDSGTGSYVFTSNSMLYVIRLA